MVDKIGLRPKHISKHQKIHFQIKTMLTQWKFFSWVRRQSETKYSHWCDENTGNDEVEEIVQCSPSNLDDKSHIQVWFRTTIIEHLIAFSRNTYNDQGERWFLDISFKDVLFKYPTTQSLKMIELSKQRQEIGFMFQFKKTVSKKR